MPPTFRRLRLLTSWLLALSLARLYVEMGWVKFDPEWQDYRILGRRRLAR